MAVLNFDGKQDVTGGTGRDIWGPVPLRSCQELRQPSSFDRAERIFAGASSAAHHFWAGARVHTIELVSKWRLTRRLLAVVQRAFSVQPEHSASRRLFPDNVSHENGRLVSKAAIQTILRQP